MGLYDACVKCGDDKSTEDVRLGSHRIRLCTGCTRELRAILNEVIISWVKNKKPGYYKRLGIPPEKNDNKPMGMDEFNLLKPN